MSTRIDLPPELETFARDCVTSGRYSDTNDVIRAALRRLQDAEARRIRLQRPHRPGHQELPGRHAESRPTLPLWVSSRTRTVGRHTSPRPTMLAKTLID